MALKLYDTLSGKKKVLKPRSGNMIEIFVCGPTVYDYSHIGHARTYIAFDAFVKYLKSQDYEVRYVQNITDVDDKIIARAHELSLDPREIARTHEAEYLHDMEGIGVHGVDRYARATDYIPQIISQVTRLVEKGYGYHIPGDGIYFDISKFADYGKLSGRTAEQAEDAVSRIDESVKKRNKGDFVLWKIWNPSAGAGEPKWESPWGDGRPGWHIEDTAITETEFGAQYDIHGGARDLMFPHHESEIAQMESLSEKTPLVNYWMHTGFLTVQGEKMSKSLGNFITIHEFLREHSKEAFRLFVLSSHYRSPIDYGKQAVEQAEANVRRLGEFYTRVSKVTPKASPKVDVENRFVENFGEKLADDFNTPEAIAVVFNLVRETNARLDRGEVKQGEAAGILAFLDYANTFLGIILRFDSGKIPREILDLAAKREGLRAEEKWEEADMIRQEIEKFGYVLEDTSEGSQIKKRT